MLKASGNGLLDLEICAPAGASAAATRIALGRQPENYATDYRWAADGARMTILRCWGTEFALVGEFR